MKYKPRTKPDRRLKMTPATIAKLEQAFGLGATDREACFYADISPALLYKYQEKRPEFIERKELLKARPVLLARQSVIKHMETDGALAMKFLERKQREEFATRGEVTGADGDSMAMNTTVLYMPKALPEDYFKAQRGGTPKV